MLGFRGGRQARRARALLIVLLILLAALPAAGCRVPALSMGHAPATPVLPGAAGGERAFVTRVVDGDTIEVEMAGGAADGAADGRRATVRYILIDTPERGAPLGAEAAAANQALVGGQIVTLVRDRSETDRYGRLLRYVYRADGTFVNAALVRDGWARVVVFDDTALEEALRAAEREAQAARRGIWAPGAPDSFPPPTATPAASGAPGAGGCAGERTPAPDPACPIKGNVSAAGERIYHLPGQEHYCATVIRPQQGERWFCTAAEAEAAGWRAATK